MVSELDVPAGEGRTLHTYDAGTGGTDALAVFWHHGTPNIGAPPEPLFAAADRLEIRWLSYDRPGYGGSTPRPGRDVGSAAGDVATIADALGVERFGVMGHSGGGPHALACAGLMSERVMAAVSTSGLAPFAAEGLDWFDGMVPSGVASLRAASEGREAKAAYESSGAQYDPGFTPEDMATLSGDWAWLNEVVGPAVAAGPGGLIDDDIAYVSPWSFDPRDIEAPTLFVHGGRDRIVPSAHSVWLASRCPNAELRLSPDDGHISILRSAESALEWLRQQVPQ